MCTYPDAYLMWRFSQFDADITIFRYEQLQDHFKNLDFLLFHSISYRTPHFVKTEIHQNNYFKKIEDFRLNILNQNIQLMPTPEAFDLLKKSCKHLTQTTSHKQYSTQEFKEKYDFPLHYLSVFGSPERYKRTKLDEKENLILLSPDESAQKTELMNALENQFSEFEIKIVKGLRYNEYLSLISRSKIMITLGEGLDFYFIEQVFSGGISIAIYNDEFFPEDFQAKHGLFSSEDELLKEVSTYIRQALEKENYEEINNEQYQLCSKFYKYDEYRENLKRFYSGDYTFK
ncbi:hypothetical protein FNH22_25935 [Fulvivirga sp. M361]|uniref:hypothetical protein n=1 Tax=Fulvivirga sp. M361 TaxID=2594266 RepID=UPI00117AFE9A|nr:hypothetical protein [Fulvivirga sp. M361]TRX50217.1 hypothetical protein FNH22_25935 [Fulvivirga sp. M361]